MMASLKKHGSWAIRIVLLSILVLPSYSDEVLLSTEQPFSLGNNTTLVIEDVNPPQGVVWLKLYGMNETLGSAVLGIGGYLKYDNVNLTVCRIYAGGDSDLVAFLVNNETTAYASGASSNDSLNKSQIGNKSSARKTLLKD